MNDLVSSERLSHNVSKNNNFLDHVILILPLVRLASLHHFFLTLSLVIEKLYSNIFKKRLTNNIIDQYKSQLIDGYHLQPII